MNEFVTVSSSSYDPASLASKLTEKAADGWIVVAIVPTGGDVTAFLSRQASGSPTSAPPAADAAATAEPVVEAPPAVVVAVDAAPPTPEPVAEPAGWAVAPEPTPAAAPSATSNVGAVAPGAQATSPVAPAVAVVATPAAVTPPAATPVAAAPAAVSPAVPAGWYADPAGRFELRYWDGGTWTEHVSRAGQQFTDPPVA